MRNYQNEHFFFYLKVIQDLIVQIVKGQIHNIVKCSTINASTWNRFWPPNGMFVRREVETREKATRENAKKVVTVQVWQIKEELKRE